MKWLVYILLALEVLLVGCAVAKTLSSNLAVLLIAGNSVLLIWCAARLRRKPSCCR
jgi:hypothetical protein